MVQNKLFFFITLFYWWRFMPQERNKRRQQEIFWERSTDLFSFHCIICVHFFFSIRNSKCRAVNCFTRHFLPRNTINFMYWNNFWKVVLNTFIDDGMADHQYKFGGFLFSGLRSIESVATAIMEMFNAMWSILSHSSGLCPFSCTLLNSNSTKMSHFGEIPENENCQNDPCWVSCY
jgi:hypothetical protein